MMATLLESSYFALFLIVALGFVLGKINIRGISLDVSAVIFIALLFGHFGVVIPKELGNFGLVLFIFTIGIQAGPGFFDSFRNKGKTLILVTLLIVASACLTGIGLMYALGIPTDEMAGLIAGALTSTPGLAAAIDATGSSAASIAYGIAYPFGVIGVILFVKLLPKMLGVDLKREELRLDNERREAYPPLQAAVFRIGNAAIEGKSLDFLRVRSMTGAVISRICHDGTVELPAPESVLHVGDLVKAVGDEAALERAGTLLGERVAVDLPLDTAFEVQKILVTNKKLVGKSLGVLSLQAHFNCTVTRLRRSGIDLSPAPELLLKFGDKLTVVGQKDSLSALAKQLGNDEKRLSDTDFFPIAMGIVLGVLFGKINISFSDTFSFSPGLTGGVLIVALVLSALGKTGPIIWSMSGSANQLLRQLGLLLFLAEVGTSAGANLVATFQESGWSLFFVGMAVTLVPMVIAALLGYFAFKISIFDLLGVITGGMTSTPGLVAADAMTDSPAPSVAYATVYPVAMVFLIIFIQVIAAVL